MPIDVGSIIQYKHFQSYRGQQTLNVQHYVITAMESPADDLSDYTEVFFQTYSDAMRPQQVSGLTHVRGELYEVNGLDFGIYVPPTPEAGTVASDGMGTFVAVKIQQVRASRATRHGWKRVSGVPETSASNGQLIPANLTAWQGIADLLWLGTKTYESPVFPETRSISFQPIIWGGNDPDFPLGRYSTIEDVAVSPELTTQNTRKIGRGA